MGGGGVGVKGRDALRGSDRVRINQAGQYFSVGPTPTLYIQIYTVCDKRSKDIHIETK